MRQVAINTAPNLYLYATILKKKLQVESAERC